MTEAEKERAAVVAWLREPEKRFFNRMVGHSDLWDASGGGDEGTAQEFRSFLRSFARAIERGDHLKGTGDE